MDTGAATAGDGHQWKIYAKFNRIDFRRINRIGNT
jgi:hypothetical protein